MRKESLGLLEVMISDENTESWRYLISVETDLSIGYQSKNRVKVRIKYYDRFKKDRNIEPIDENLSIVLGDSFSAYKTLVEKLSDFEAILEWRFNKDGGWLAKVTQKKQTIFWGQAAVGCFT